jgi:hypothetical protein
MSGFQVLRSPFRSSSDGVVCSVRLPRKYARLLHLSPATSRSLSRCWFQRSHSNRKCLIVSLWIPLHSHLSESEAPILARYSFRRLFTVLSWHRVDASLYGRWSYRAFVCFPGSALSIVYGAADSGYRSCLQVCMYPFILYKYACTRMYVPVHTLQVCMYPLKLYKYACTRSYSTSMHVPVHTLQVCMYPLKLYKYACTCLNSM